MNQIEALAQFDTGRLWHKHENNQNEKSCHAKRLHSKYQKLSSFQRKTRDENKLDI